MNTQKRESGIQSDSSTEGGYDGNPVEGSTEGWGFSKPGEEAAWICVCAKYRSRRAGSGVAFEKCTIMHLKHVDKMSFQTGYKDSICTKYMFKN